MPRLPVHQAWLWQQRGHLVCLPSRFLSRRKKQWFQRVHLPRLVAAREPVVFQLASRSLLGVELALLAALQGLLKRLPSALLSACPLTHSHLRGSDSRLCSNLHTCCRWPSERQVDQPELLALQTKSQQQVDPLELRSPTPDDIFAGCTRFSVLVIPRGPIGPVRPGPEHVWMPVYWRQQCCSISLLLASRTRYLALAGHISGRGSGFCSPHFPSGRARYLEAGFAAGADLHHNSAGAPTISLGRAQRT